MDNASRAHQVSKSRANRLVLVDGNAILHRAYHALPPLTSPDGALVNAVYGFTSMLLKIWNDFHPTHLAIAFDRPEPTFRKKMFTGYQAKRPEMEDNLVSQIDKVRAVIAAMGIPMFDAAGFEADDVIGTLSKKFDNAIIVTGDRDLLQLISDKREIKVFMPVKGLSEGKLFDEKEAKEKLGVAPKQIPDYKALAGDASDNYPGVPGIGPKTAIKLLETYKTLDNVLQSKKLTPQERESALLSKDLATIRTDAPIDTDLKDLTITSLNTPAAREKLTEFNFKSLLGRLAGEGKVEKPKEKRVKKEEKKTNQTQLSLV